MQHLIAKTGLGMTINYVIKELKIEKDKQAIKSLLIDAFTNKFEQFRKRHTCKFGPSALLAYYIVQNQYPVGQNDIHQYFRALAFDVKINNGNLSLGSKEERKNFTIIQGYSRNDNSKKKVLPKVNSNENCSKDSTKGSRMKHIVKIQPQKRSAQYQWKDYVKTKKQLNPRKLLT